MKLYFASQNGMQDVICFLREHHASLQLGEEKNQIIKTALKLICNDIATLTQRCTPLYKIWSIFQVSWHLFLRAFRCFWDPYWKQMRKWPFGDKTSSKLIVLGQGYLLYNLTINVGRSGCSTSCTGWDTVMSYKIIGLVSSTKRKELVPPFLLVLLILLLKNWWSNKSWVWGWRWTRKSISPCVCQWKCNTWWSFQWDWRYQLKQSSHSVCWRWYRFEHSFYLWEQFLSFIKVTTFFWWSQCWNSEVEATWILKFKFFHLQLDIRQE